MFVPVRVSVPDPPLVSETGPLICPPKVLSAVEPTVSVATVPTGVLMVLAVPPVFPAATASPATVCEKPLRLSAPAVAEFGVPRVTTVVAGIAPAASVRRVPAVTKVPPA